MAAVDTLSTEPRLEPEGGQRSWRRVLSLLWLILVVALIAYFIISRRDELSDIGDVLSSADRRWIIVAGIIEVVILTLMSKTHQTILKSLGHQVPLHSIAGAYLKGLAVGTVVPFGGPAAVIVFIRSLVQVGVPANDGVFSTTLASLSGFASFLVMMLALIFTLFVTSRLPAFVVGATLALLLIFLLAAAAVVIPLRWRRLPSWVTRYLPGWISRFLTEARHHQIIILDLRRPFLYSLGVDACGAVMLYASLFAIGEKTNPMAAFAGYQVEMLFNVITPLFQGIGIADLSIAVALHTLGVGVSQAAAATLVYRLWDLWVPLLLGALIYFVGRGRRRHPSSTAH